MRGYQGEAAEVLFGSEALSMVIPRPLYYRLMTYPAGVYCTAPGNSISTISECPTKTADAGDVLLRL